MDRLVLDDGLGLGDGCIDIGIFPPFALVMIPGGPLLDEEGADGVFGVPASEEGEDVGEVGFGFGSAQISGARWRGRKAHRPPWGWRGKGLRGRRSHCLEEMLGDDGRGVVVDPDEAREWILPVGGPMAGFAVAEAGAPAETVVGIGGRIAVKHVEEDAFMVEIQGVGRTDPDLEVVRGGLDDHATGPPGVVRLAMVTANPLPGQIIGQEIAGLFKGLKEDVAA
ncbi:hypothetical protein TRIP_B200699 [uncultured Desulfatiglans sp.]|nr:hypothetical protein TRIP_B200699 [uncultured Desulfatiglans sp.]